MNVHADIAGSNPSPAGLRAPQPEARAASSQAVPAAGGLDLSDLLRVVSERRYIIIGIAALGLVLGIIASLMMTPLYRAAALLELNPPQVEVLNERQAGRSTESSGQEMLRTQLGLLKSETLARRVVQELNLSARPDFGGAQVARKDRIDNAARVVLGNTTAEEVKGSMLVRVAHSSPDPVLAARIANALANGFIAANLERRYDSSSYARDFLRNQLASTKEALETSERRLNRSGMDSGIFRTPGQVVNGVASEGSTLSATNLTAINEALNQARIRRITTEQAFRNGVRAPGTPGAAAGSAELRAQRSLLQADYNDKSRLFKPDYPEMRQLAARMATLDRAIATDAGTSSSARSADLNADYKAAQAAEQQLADEVARYKSEVQAERARSINYGILQREVDTNRALYDALLQRYKEIGVAGGIGQSNVSLVDSADPPRAPYRPNIPLNATIGLILGLVLGSLGAFAVHLFFDHLTTPADIRQNLHLPVLGVIPVERESRTLAEALEDRKSEVSEAYFAARTSISFLPGGQPQSVLFTSTRPGEGKSTSAYAIAGSFATTGQRVLLIDADLRKPTFASGKSDERGLAYLLTSDEPLLSYVEKTRNDNLSLLPVGRFSGSVGELLGMTRLPMLIEEAKQAFDMVVVDGPPVLGFADAPLLGSMVDATLLVIESGETRTAHVSEMVRRLEMSGTRIAGVILTKVAGKQAGYGYYAYAYGEDGSSGQVSSDRDRVLDISKPETT